MVIPTFNLRWFFEEDETKELPFSAVQEQAVKAFDKFIQNIDQEDPVLMWALNHHLNVNETVPLGLLSGSSINDQRERYFALLKALRHIHYEREFDKDTLAWKRPLALPINLGSVTSPSEVSWYIAFTETKWALWPKGHSEVGYNQTLYNALRRAGAFDVWLAEIAKPTTADGKEEILEHIRWWNSTFGDADPSSEQYWSGVKWRDLGTATMEDDLGETFPACAGMSQRHPPGACSYPTQKVVLYQFGFAALSHGRLLKLSEDINDQQKYLREVWEKIEGNSETPNCVRNAIVDQWADDWTRCETGVRGLSFNHQKGGQCDEVRPGQMLHAQWLGLNSQYTFFGLNCIDPRYRKLHPLSGRNIDGTPGNSQDTDFKAFGFNASTFATDEEFGSLCQLMMPDLAQKIELCVVVLVIILIGWWRWKDMSKRRLHANKEEEEDVDDQDAVDSTPSKSKEPLAQTYHTQEVDIPHKVGGGGHWPQSCRKFAITLKAQQKNEKGRGRFTQMHARVTLQAHTAAQSRRLEHQLECEALAVQAQRGALAKLSDCYAEAMVNMHARVLEGYTCWLESRTNQDPSLQDWCQAMCECEHRHAWELFVEALLCRVVESLAEQALHAPEFLHAFYHSVRWNETRKVINLSELPSEGDLHFEIDYHLLHSGIEHIMRNPNPFKGGIGFEDMNDRGVMDKIDSLEEKTFRESVGLMVIVDIFSNFLPVFVIKMWMFGLAWYVYLGSDKKNGDFFDPTYRRFNFLSQFTTIDAVLWFAWEFIFIFHGIWQKRGNWLAGVNPICSNWLKRRCLNSVITLAGIVLVWVGPPYEEIDWTITLDDVLAKHNPENKEYQSQQVHIQCCFAYFCIRGLILWITTQPSEQPFIPGTPQGRRNRKLQEGVTPLTASADILLPQSGTTGESDVPELGSFTPFALREEDIDRKSERGAYQAFNALSYFAWATMLGVTWIFEVYGVAPLAAEFDGEEFCGENCGKRKISNTWFLYGSDCFACSFTVGLVLMLVYLTAFFDIYFTFYFGTAIFGYAQGEYRNLRNILSTTLRHLDFDCDHVSSQRQGTGKQLRLQLTDGDAMKAIFGCSWRMAWSRMVESLHEDCLVTGDDVVKMCDAAGTTTWSRRDVEENEFATVRDKFTELKFKSTKTRGDEPNGGSEKGRTRCMSILQVKFHHNEPPVDFVVEEEATMSICVKDAEERSRIAQQMRPDDVTLVDDVVLADGTLKKNWQLMSGEDVQAFTTSDLWDRLNEVDRFPSVHMVFKKADVKFNEVMVQFEEARAVHAISFCTGIDDASLDPVCWSVEGKAHESNVWKQLIWVATPFSPPSARRKEPIKMFFPVEYWRKKDRPGGRKTIDLQTCAHIVHEKLGFFVASLRGILSGEKYALRPGIDTLLDCHIGTVPMLSQVIPCYAETIINDEKSLRDHDGVNTNLAFLISAHYNEWNIFAEKNNMAADELFHTFNSGEMAEWSAPLMDPSKRDSLTEEQLDSALEAKKLSQEVRLWAGMRSQTVGRTIVGAMYYHDVVALMPNVSRTTDTGQIFDRVSHVTELILAHQTYGSKKAGAVQEAMDADVRYMLSRYPNMPFYLVCDYDSTNARPTITRAVNNFVAETYNFEGLRFASVKSNYALKRSSKKHVIPPEDGVAIIDVLPRYFGLLVGKPGYMSQGKAGNQLGALRFARGHFMQMMDANMGAFLGEATKVPFVLRRFQPHDHDRRFVQARIIGFREFIFTQHHGQVGAIMGSAEWSFGTICQRFLSGLGARMHYGHPDFLDGFWASNRGSLSKASPAINLSEDIFAGFNVRMRNERSTHVDYLGWEKGREASFNAACLFFAKVSGGNVGVMRSRDLKIICENLSILDSFSFYFASIGFYLNNVIIDMSTMIYVSVFILLTLSSKELNDIGQLDSTLAAEWVLSLGIIAMIPRLLELVLEYGPLEGMMVFFPSMIPCMMMFTFVNKSIAMAVVETMATGEAHYIATGRPNANTHYNWRECYFLFVKTHFYPGLQVLMMWLIYTLLAQEFSVSSLPMIMVAFSATMWVVSPIIFCPQPTLVSLTRDLSELWAFIIATPDYSIRTAKFDKNKTTEQSLRADFKDQRATLFEFWLKHSLEHKKAGDARRVLIIFYESFKFVLVLSVVYSSMVDNLWDFILLVLVNFAFWDTWRLLSRPTFGLLIVILMWVLSPFLFFDMPMINFWTFLILCIQFFSVVKELIFFACWKYFKPSLDWPSMPEATADQRAQKKLQADNARSYDMVVEYFYVNFLTHLAHLMSALVLLVLWFSFQFVCVFLDLLWGLHSWFMLNVHLRSTGCCARRKGFEPGEGRRSPSSARYLRLAGRDSD
jgi:hypothetical protein